jgi:hypothetical protein
MLDISGKTFSTVDNAVLPAGCNYTDGGWWYHQCHYVNLNRRWHWTIPGCVWLAFPCYDMMNVQETVMMIKKRA